MIQDNSRREYDIEATELQNGKTAFSGDGQGEWIEIDVTTVPRP